ncbi:MAG: hypothetical protein KDA24_19905 [Deltaproteobacteria bacterium]|nr:hypothetical protein [Deltaproteobacteria bacterium]
MRTLLLLLLSFVLACGPTPSEPVAPVEETPTQEETPAPSAEAATDAASEPATEEAPPVTAPVWSLPREAGTMADTFTFLGWSTDNRRYAFQLNIEAQGASCSAKHEVFVVDAATDSFPEGGKLLVAHESPEGGPDGCVPKTLEPQLEEGRARMLEAHGITLGNHVGPSLITRREDGLFEAKHSGGSVAFTFIVRHPVTDDIYGEAGAKGAGYVLTLHSDGDTPKVVEDGKRRRPYVLNYSVLGAPFFVSPDGKHAALIVRRSLAAFEGTRTSYMSNGLALSVTE